MSRLIGYQKGMTLIELLAVVTVVGIITAFAYPAYNEHIARAYREEAKAGLVKLQLWMEQEYNKNGAYPIQVDSNSCIGCGLNLERYNYSATFGTGANIYKLSATPKVADRCGTLYLNAAGHGSTSENGDCW